MRVARHESTAPHHQLVDDQEGEYTLRISDAASPTVGPNLEHRVLQAERRAADAERRAADAEARTAIADAELSRLNRDLAMARVELAERMNAETATSATIEAVREMASTRDALVAVFDRSAERHDAAMASARSRFERTARNLVMRAERAVASADAAARASETAALNIREAVSSSLHTPSRRSTRASDFGRSLRDVVEHATCPSPTSPSSAVSPSSTASPAPSLTASKMESLTDVSSSSAGNGQPEPVCSTSKFSPRSPPTGEKSHASDSSSDGGVVCVSEGGISRRSLPKTIHLLFQVGPPSSTSAHLLAAAAAASRRGLGVAVGRDRGDLSRATPGLPRGMSTRALPRRGEVMRQPRATSSMEAVQHVWKGSWVRSETLSSQWCRRQRGIRV